MAEVKPKKTKPSRPTMKLYYHPFYSSCRCVWLVKELGVEDEFEFIKMDTMKRDSDERRDYQNNVHPHGTVPALVIEGEPPLLESGAICMYLADKYGRLAPDVKDRKDYYDWILHACATIDKIVGAFYDQWMLTPETPDDKLIEEMTTKFHRCMETLTRTLRGRQFVCSDSLTAADCVLGYSIWAAAYMKDGILLKDFPEVLEYYNRIRSRKQFQETFSKPIVLH